MSPKTEPRVTVTVILYNSEDLLKECLDSIRGPAAEGLASVVAVDNASPDSSAEIIRSRYPWVKLIESSANVGFAAGCNLSWKAVDSDYWLLMNPDAKFLDAGGLERLVAWMDRHPDVGVASPDVLAAHGGSAFPARRYPTIFLFVLEGSRIRKLLPDKVRASIMLGPYWNRGDMFDAEWVPGTAMIIRRKAVEEAGLLSEKFFMYGEDIEFCWRVRKAGWKVGYCDSVKVHHGDSSSAVRTWGNAEKENKIARGIFDAVCEIFGVTYARRLFRTYHLLSYLESKNPVTRRQEREAAGNRARVYREVLAQLK